VAQASAGRNDLVVRGGAPSENLYLVDGFVVPNINHFGTQGATGGPISYINLDFVRETSFSSGGFPVNFGNNFHLSFQFDLRNGRTDRIGGKATISASEFGLDLEGPITQTAVSSFLYEEAIWILFLMRPDLILFPNTTTRFLKQLLMLILKSNINYLLGALDYVNFNNSTSDNRYQNSQILGSNQNNYLAGVSYQHLFDNGFYNIRLSRNYTNYDQYQNDTLLNSFLQINPVKDIMN